MSNFKDAEYKLADGTKSDGFVEEESGVAHYGGSFTLLKREKERRDTVNDIILACANENVEN